MAKTGIHNNNWKGGNILFKCEVCEIETSQPKSQYKNCSHHYCSSGCYQKTLKDKVGEKHHLFKGGYKDCICFVCKVQFTKKLSKVNQCKNDRHFCSLDCNYKYRRSEDNAIKAGKFIPCNTCGKSNYYPKYKIKNEFHYCDKICMFEHRKATGFYKGKNNGNYTGADRDLSALIRNSPEYYNWRTQVFTRDNYKCVVCDVVGAGLAAHHIKHFAEIIKENTITTIEEAFNCNILWDINNGVTLCKKHHKETHDNYRLNNNK